MRSPVNSIAAAKNPIDQGKHNQYVIDVLTKQAATIVALQTELRKAVERKSSTVSNIAVFNESTVDFGDGTIKHQFIGNSTKVVAINPVAGAFMYADGGAIKGRGSGGTVTTMAAADPHCPVCGSDYVAEFDSERDGHFIICFKCLADHLEEKNDKVALAWVTREESQLAEVKEKKRQLSITEQPAEAEKVEGDSGSGK